MSKAVLVTDMSSFTSSTETRGIIDVGAKIFALRELLLPLMRSYGAHASAEADNCRGIFDDPKLALAAAFACRRAVEDYNSQAAEWGQLELDGLGLDWGEDIQLDGHTLAGSVVDTAFQLAENIAKDGQVLISPATEAALRERECHLSCRRLHSGELLSTDGGHYWEVTKPIFMVAPHPTLPVEYENADENRLADLCRRRLVPGADTVLIDQQIRSQFIERRTAMLYDILPQDRTSLGRQLEIRDILRSVARAYGGYIWPDDDRLFMFSHPSDALATAIEARHRLLENGTPVRSFGIDHGDVLAIEGTVVHWGSPVNSAAKLSEDIASTSQILVSDRARFQIQRQLSILEKCIFSPHEAEKSGVKFEHWDVEFTPTEQMVKILSEGLD